jgi:hypothetical protein
MNHDYNRIHFGLIARARRDVWRKSDIDRNDCPTTARRRHCATRFATAAARMQTLRSVSALAKRMRALGFNAASAS